MPSLIFNIQKNQFIDYKECTLETAPTFIHGIGVFTAGLAHKTRFLSRPSRAERMIMWNCCILPSFSISLFPLLLNTKTHHMLDSRSSKYRSCCLPSEPAGGALINHAVGKSAISKRFCQIFTADSTAKTDVT